MSKDDKMAAGAAAGDLIVKARAQAKALLHKNLLERWQHSLRVATRAEALAPTVPPEDRALLVAAAWLHDIGYTPRLKRTWFHPLGGGLYLRNQGWDEDLCALVAHHSGARFVPVERGFTQLLDTLTFVQSPLSDALTYADQTVGPGGKRMTTYRINEAITRHGPNSPNARARVARVPYLLAVADRVEQRLAP